jgi:hypothetical protein
MSAVVLIASLRKALILAALFALSLASGCATTTTASVQATMHSPDSFRFQSSDVTATLQVALAGK